MSDTEYAKLYDEYWSRPDRWGAHSFDDPDRLADRILSVAGGGKLLDVGSGMGLLVRTLLSRGVDAYGIDVADEPVRCANRLTPDRFRVGSVLDLPYEAEMFPTITCTDVLEHIAENDVPRALSELHRVTGRCVFAVVATSPDRDATWHLTVHDRAWWENQFFQAGFRRHPLLHAVVPYEWLEHEPNQVTLIFEKISAEARGAYSLTDLHREHDLHMDMLRETGRRADAHTARYALACEYVRPGDEVVDVACGLGYGSAILAQGSSARQVVGIDNSPFAVEYADANYAVPGRIEFRTGSAENLADIPDNGVDVVVSFETLEHLAEPTKLLAEAHRILRPGGRFIASVPNDWTDQTGSDPNPHHLHVYSWETLCKQIAEHFLIEDAHAQIAGGGLKLADQPRRLCKVSTEQAPDHDAEWWIVSAMKDPTVPSPPAYKETCYTDYGDVKKYNLTAFDRDYANAWVVKAMVSMGMRNRNPDALRTMAETLLRSAPPGSPDTGAALCILGYRLLDQGRSAKDAPSDPADIASLLDRIEAYHEQAVSSPHAWRWRISNQYIAAHLLLKLGQRKEARAAFLRCAEFDFLNFSPLLATKTVDALFQAGLLASCDNDLPAARDCWQRGLAEAHRALTAPWTNIWASQRQPVPFGLAEARQVLDFAVRCANGLIALDDWTERGGFVWTVIHANVTNQIRTLNRHRQEVVDRAEVDRARFTEIEQNLIRERDALKEEAERLSTQWMNQDARIRELEEEKKRLWSEAQRLGKAWEEQKQWIKNVEADRDRLAAQSASLEERLQQQTNEFERLRRLAKKIYRFLPWLRRK